MTALDYFYKLGQEQAIKEVAVPIARDVLHIDPSIVNELYPEEPHIVRDQSLRFAKNFLRSRAALEQKLLKLMLRKGINTVEGTAAEGAHAIAGHPKR
jgi:hypothetical protein